MMWRVDPNGSALEIILLALQVFQVAFLLLHDWIPLGRLNDVAAVQSQDSRTRLVMVTVLSSVPFAFGLVFTVRSFGQPIPLWLYVFLWVIYVGLLLGQLRAWWVPYLFAPDARRATRYRAMFANTHAFLPPRNGLVPNTLHVILHVTTAATLVVLFLIKFMS